jgi:plasmid stabilization system protein ParE
MEEGIPRKPVEVSNKFKVSRTHIYDYTLDTFGLFQAERYAQLIEKALDTLYNFYLAYPECRHIPTKSRKYRNIILEAHLIIYRITDERIEVLDILHSASSIRKIRDSRSIRL